MNRARIITRVSEITCYGRLDGRDTSYRTLVAMVLAGLFGFSFLRRCARVGLLFVMSGVGFAEEGGREGVGVL